MDAASLTRIEKTHYVLGAALVAVVAVLGTGPQALGAAVGAALSALNFTVIRGILQRMMAAPPGERSKPMLVLIPKMAALMLAVALAIYFLPLSAAMLAVGFSIFLISIAIETVRFVSRPPGGAGRAEADVDHG
jgi:hypothetical protein